MTSAVGPSTVCKVSGSVLFHFGFEKINSLSQYFDIRRVEIVVSSSKSTVSQKKQFIQVISKSMTVLKSTQQQISQ